MSDKQQAQEPFGASTGSAESQRAEFREWLKWRQILNANLTMSLGLVLLSTRWSWLSFPAGLFVGSAATITVLLATGILPPKQSPNAQGSPTVPGT